VLDFRSLSALLLIASGLAARPEPLSKEVDARREINSIPASKHAPTWTAPPCKARS
jgi:hypothetical protein